MKFLVNKHSVNTSDTEYDVRFSEATRKAVRKTAKWTALTASVVGLTLFSAKMKSRNHEDTTPVITDTEE